jgi:sortase A
MVILGVMVFSRAEESVQSASLEPPVARVSVPMISEAPEAVPEQAKEKAASEQKAAPQEKSSGDAGKDEAAKQVEKEKPAAPVPATKDLWMTIPKLGLYDNYVSNSDAESALDYGAAKRVETGFPWQAGDVNTYISAHRLGWPGTGSWHQFYNLPLLTYGDQIYLYDANGTTYTYEVSEIYEVLPTETWVTQPRPGRDIVSLQTCIENYGDYWTMGPDWYVRYVVRADRIAITPG